MKFFWCLLFLLIVLCVSYVNGINVIPGVGEKASRQLLTECDAPSGEDEELILQQAKEEAMKFAEKIKKDYYEASRRLYRTTLQSRLFPPEEFELSETARIHDFYTCECKDKKQDIEACYIEAHWQAMLMLETPSRRPKPPSASICLDHLWRHEKQPPSPPSPPPPSPIPVNDELADEEELVYTITL